MLKRQTIVYEQWKKISDPGESGCVCSAGEFIAAIATIATLAYPAARSTADPTGMSSVGVCADTSYWTRDFDPKVALDADNGNDVYYATLLDVNETAELIADFS